MADGGYWARDLLLMTLLLGVLFGFKLGERPLWSPDEGRYSEIPREMVASGDYITPRLNGVKYFEKPPLFYWLQSLSIKIFGLSEWSLRLWTATLAYLGCLAVYVAGRSLYGQRAGLMAAVVLGTSLLYYGMSRIITLDMAVSVLLSYALLAFLLGVREPAGARRRFAMWAFYLFAALATMTKGLIGIVIPGLVIGSWMAVLGERRVLKAVYLPSGFAIFMLVVLPWHISVSRVNPEFLNFYIVHEHFQRYLTKHHGSLDQVWIFIPVLLIGLFPWSAFLVQALRRNLSFSWRQRQQHKEAIFLFLWASLVFLFFSGSSSKLIPYILPVFPPLAILIARYFAEAWNGGEAAGVPAGYWVLLVASFLLVAGGSVMGQRYLTGHVDGTQMTRHMYGLAAVLTIGTLATLILGRHGGFRHAFLSLTLTALLLLVTLNGSLMLFNQWRSVKELASAARLRLMPQDEVISYQTYYQDLPVYLERRITVVRWKGELDFGARNEDVSDWIIDEPTFWRRWDGPGTIYMFTPWAKYSKLVAKSGQKLYLIAHTGHDVLLSNKANPTESRSRGSGRALEEHRPYSSRIERPLGKEAL